jgi:hypothetical protein
MRRVLSCLAVLTLAFGLSAGPVAAKQPTTRIVSTSGIPHADVADYTKAKRWREGMPMGINGSWRAAIDITIGQIASEKPTAVLHTGDMVRGKWGTDPDGTGIFGPVRTTAQRKRAIVRAADLYYQQNKSWWATHGLHPHFGIGDHEIGNVSRFGVIKAHRFKARAFSTWRGAWARHFTNGGTRYALHPPDGAHRKTAYATMIGDVGLITLDPFVKRNGQVRVRIARRQLRWLHTMLHDLRRRGARYLVVQCEIPAVGPNRPSHTSGLTLENGGRLWRMLEDHRVDVLLSGEFHAMTTHSSRGTTPVQVVHGGQLYHGNANYLVIDTFDDRMELTLKRMSGKQTGTGEIWAPGHPRVPDGVRMKRGARVVGTMTIHADGSLSNRSGRLAEGISKNFARLSAKHAADRLRRARTFTSSAKHAADRLRRPGDLPGAQRRTARAAADRELHHAGQPRPDHRRTLVEVCCGLSGLSAELRRRER